jgi:WD40 repeat protein
LTAVLLIALLLASGFATLSATTEPQAKLEPLWEDLAGADAARAYRAVWALVLTPSQTVPFLEKRLHPVTADPKQIDQLIRDLDNDSFAVREKATRQLEQLSDTAEGALKEALKPAVSLEMRMRIEKLLAKLPELAATPGRRRELRALEVLELLGTKEARAVLQRLANGTPAARLTQLAQKALARLADRPRPPELAAPVPKLDLFGDPLPAGTVARLGTVRMRNSWLAAVTPDGKTVVSAAIGNLNLWDATTGQDLPGFPIKTDWHYLNALAVSPDGKLAAVAYGGCLSFDVFALPGGERVYQHRGGSQVVEPCQYAIAFTADSKTLVIGDQRNTSLWDMTTGKHIRQFSHAQGTMFIVVVSPDGKYLVTCGSVLRLWDVATGKRLHDLGDQKTLVYRAAFSPDAKVLATGGRGTPVRLWSIATGKELRALPAQGLVVSSFAFSPDSQTLAMTSGISQDSLEQRLLLWKMADADAKPRSLVPPPGIGWIQQFSPDGKTLVWRSDTSCVLLDLATGKDRHDWAAHRGGVCSLAYSSNGKLIATGGGDGTVRLWDAVTDRPLWSAVGHWYYVTGVAFSPDGKTLVSYSQSDEPAVLWDVATGTKKATLDNANDSLPRVSAAVFSADGQRVIICSNSAKWSLWETASGKLDRQFTPHNYSTTAMAVSPDGRLVASGGQQYVSVYDLAAGKALYHFRTKGELIALAFSPGGHALAALQNHDEVILWEMPTGQERARFATKRVVYGGNIVFSPDSRLLAAASNEPEWNRHNQLRVWDLATGEQLGPFPGHRAGVTQVAFSPDGSRLATASVDGTVLIRQLNGGTGNVQPW